MILCFDIGNTNIVLGIVENKKIINTYRFVTNASLTEDEYYHKIQNVIKDKTVEGVIISSVVPTLDNVFSLMIRKYFNIKPMIVGPGMIKVKLYRPFNVKAFTDLIPQSVKVVSVLD
ncbi:MAG: type III pantothenate kinase, partial [Bacilli bacterium]|nr:type III pantothenate kinase [Bacilli bacterium]